VFYSQNGQSEEFFNEIFGDKISGKLFALPTHQDVMITLYHKDLFDKFGIPYLKDGMTWDDLYAVSKRITRNEGGVNYVGYAPMIELGGPF
jgi:multiple sugar transport system substrate-binding protein